MGAPTSRCTSAGRRGACLGAAGAGAQRRRLLPSAAHCARAACARRFTPLTCCPRSTSAASLPRLPACLPRPPAQRGRVPRQPLHLLHDLRHLGGHLPGAPRAGGSSLSCQPSTLLKSWLREDAAGLAGSVGSAAAACQARRAGTAVPPLPRASAPGLPRLFRTRRSSWAASIAGKSSRQGAVFTGFDGRQGGGGVGAGAERGPPPEQRPALPPSPWLTLPSPPFPSPPLPLPPPPLLHHPLRRSASSRC